MRSRRARSSLRTARSSTRRRRRRWARHDDRGDRRALRVHPRDLRRQRGHLEGALDPAHTAHVRCERDPRDHHHRRDARVRRGRRAARARARVRRRRARDRERRRWIRRDRPDARDVQAEAGSVEEVVDLHTLIPLIYLVAAVTFVLGLKGLSGPKTAVNGNRIAAAGMLLAVAATFFDVEFQSFGTTGLIVTVIGILVGGSAGFYGARVVKMTAMPQMVALFNGAGGGAAALVSILE